MQPYYNEDGITLYHGDSLTIMPQLTTGAFDAVVTDPPYNVSKRKADIIRGPGTAFEGGDIRMDFGAWDHGSVVWTDFVDLLPRLLTPVGVLVTFYDKLYLGAIARHLAEQHGFTMRTIGAIVKRNPAPQVRKVKWQSGLEMFLVATANSGAGHHFNYRLGQSPDYISTTTNYEHHHPTQKPLDALTWIIRYWTLPGDIVLDPFAGAGTTLVAAQNLGRRAVGIELSKQYCEITVERLRQRSFFQISTPAPPPLPNVQEQLELNLTDS